MFALKKVFMFSCISGNGTFKPKPEKLKNPLLESYYILLYFQEMESYSSNIKKFLIFFQKKGFSYISGNRNSKKIPYILELCYISGNENPKTLTFQEKTFQAQKTKRTYSEKMSYISGNITF